MSGTKEIVVFNDIAGIAACTLGVAMPILTVCGYKVYPVPTAVFSSSTRVAGVQAQSLGGFMARVDGQWQGLSLSPVAVLTGCFADAEGVNGALPIVRRLHEAGSLLLVDPVMGDDGKIWAGAEHLAAMRRLVAMADVSCPNFTEFCALLGADYAAMDALPVHEKFEFIGGHAEAFGPKRFVVTGIREGSVVYNYSYDDGIQSIISGEFHGRGVCGTGDMFSCILLASVLKGEALDEGVDVATSWIGNIMRTRLPEGDYGVDISGAPLMELYHRFVG